MKDLMALMTLSALAVAHKRGQVLKSSISKYFYANEM